MRLFLDSSILIDLPRLIVTLIVEEKRIRQTRRTNRAVLNIAGRLERRRSLGFANTEEGTALVGHPGQAAFDPQLPEKFSE